MNTGFSQWNSGGMVFSFTEATTLFEGTRSAVKIFNGSVNGGGTFVYMGISEAANVATDMSAYTSVVFANSNTAALTSLIVKAESCTANKERAGAFPETSAFFSVAGSYEETGLLVWEKQPPADLSRACFFCYDERVRFFCSHSPGSA